MATYVTQEDLLIHREGLMKLINDGMVKIPATSQKISAKTINSRQAYEQVRTHGGLGLFQNMDEVEGVTYDRATTLHTKTYYPVVRTLGVKWSKQSKQKDLYGFVKAMGPMLAESAQATRNLLACNVLTLGFSGGGVTSPDGKAMFASDHPLQSGGTQSNLGTLALSGSSLEDAIQQVLAQVGERGIPRYNGGGLNLFYGPPNGGIATRAVKSEGLQGTTDNDTNAFINGMIKDLVMDPLIGFGQSGLSDAWFLLPADQDRNPIFRLAVQDIETQSDYDINYMEASFVSDFEELWDTMGYLNTYGTNP